MEDLITLYLPDAVSKWVKTHAHKLGVGMDAVCVKIISDSYYAQTAEGDPEHTSRGASEPAAEFDVARHFPSYPSQTVQLTQQFVNETAKFSNVRVAKHKRSIVFEPRFVHIDYPISARGRQPGLVVSFYGNKPEFDDPRGLLVPGPKSYARARIVNQDQLDYCRRFIAQSYQRRCGNASGVT